LLSLTIKVKVTGTPLKIASCISLVKQPFMVKYTNKLVLLVVTTMSLSITSRARTVLDQKESNKNKIIIFLKKNLYIILG
jgi:hypothetical protein